MMATVPHVSSGLGLRKFQADGFLLTRVYSSRNFYKHNHGKLAKRNVHKNNYHWALRQRDGERCNM